MVVFEFSISLISLVTGSIFLWLNRTTREQEYFLFSLVCFSASLYTGAAMLMVIYKDAAVVLYRYQRIAIVGAIMIVAFTMHFVMVFVGKRSKRFLLTVYLVCICLCLLALFDLHFYDIEWVKYQFTALPFEIHLRKPGVGYNVFALVVLIATAYSISMLTPAYKRGAQSVISSLFGLSLMSTFAVYDTLWAQRLVFRPLLPLTEFGILGMVAGMAITLIKRFIDSNTQLERVVRRVKSIEQDNYWLRETVLKYLKSKSADSKRIVFESQAERFLKQIEAIVVENLDDPEFAAEQFARALHMTRVHLNRKLKALTGLTTSHFIRVMRLEYAAQLLKMNSTAITEIAGRVGFDNLSYFNRSFKQHFKVTPSAFRQRGHTAPTGTRHERSSELW